MARIISFILIVMVWIQVGAVRAQTVDPTGPDLGAPVFQQIDANGVDLIHGYFRISSPEISVGDPNDPFAFRLDWSGRSWQLNAPSFWINDDDHFVFSMENRSDEFNKFGGSSGLQQVAPGKGANISLCSTYSGKTYINTCTYTNRNGYKIRIFGVPPGIAGLFQKGATDVFGNNFIQDVYYGNPSGYGRQYHVSYAGDVRGSGQGFDLYVGRKNDPIIYANIMKDGVSIKKLQISTPNLTPGNNNDTYLRPKNVTQTFTDPLGNVWSFVFNGDGDLVSYRRPTSGVSNAGTLTYDGQHRVKTFNNGQGTWTYTYSTSGSIGTTTVLDPEGHQTLVRYLIDKSYATLVQDPLGRTTTYYYDSSGQLISLALPECYAYSTSCRSMEFEYDARGNIIRKTIHAKPGSGLADIVLNAEYPATCPTGADPDFSVCNNPTAIIDARGNRTDYTYAANGLPATVTQPPAVAGAVRPQVRNTYSGFRLTQSSSCRTLANCAGTADESKTTITYDSNLWPISQTIAAGDGSISSTTTISYDVEGNAISVDGPLPGAGDTTLYHFDIMRRVTGTINPAANDSATTRTAVRNSYNGDGQIVLEEQGMVTGTDWATFAPAQSVETRYDLQARKSREILAGGGNVRTVTQFSYDALSRLTCTAVRMNSATFGTLPASACTLGASGTQGPDRITQNKYDEAGQLEQVRRALGTPLEQAYATYAYSLNGKQTTVIDARGNRANFIYDGFDRLSQWQFPATSVVTGFNPATPDTALATAGSANSADYEGYTYDPAGNRLTLRKRDARVITFTYDALNRMTSKIIPNSCVAGYACTPPPASAVRDVYYAYDLFGLQTGAYFDSLGGADRLLTSYDALRRLTASTLTMNGQARTLSYQYDAASNRTRLTFPDSAYFTYSYDYLNHMVDIRDSSSTVLTSLTYDNLGRRNGLTGGGSSSYSYDSVSRLSGIAHSFTNSSYTVSLGFPQYNPASQITQRTLSNDLYAFRQQYNTDRIYVANGLNQYTTAGSAAPAYDSNGNLISLPNAGYGYDVENRLISATGNIPATLVYTPTGQLYETATPSGTIRYLYDGDALVAEYNSAGTLQNRYLHGPGTDVPLIWFEGGNRRHLRANHQGSIIAVSDSAGNALAANSYDEYGVAATSNRGRFAYTGQIALPDLPFYYYKARVYAPRIGRFLQTDPVGYEDQINLYAYVGNDPINGSDPSGMCNTFWDCFTGGTFKQADGSVIVESPIILRMLVPGQVAWDKARTSWANGDRDTATVQTVAAIGEIGVTTLTAGAGNAALQSGRAIARTVGTAQAIRATSSKNLLGQVTENLGAQGFTAPRIKEIMGWGERATGALTRLESMEGAAAAARVREAGMTRDMVQALRNGYQDAAARSRGIGVAPLRVQILDNILSGW